jgi:hypothetical protein
MTMGPNHLMILTFFSLFLRKPGKIKKIVIMKIVNAAIFLDFNFYRKITAIRIAADIGFRGQRSFILNFYRRAEEFSGIGKLIGKKCKSIPGIGNFY